MKERASPKHCTREDAEIGARIRFLRMQAEKSQTWLANQLGVTFQQVQKYEKGVNRVGAARLQRIATIFGTTVDKLMPLGAVELATGERFDVFDCLKDRDAVCLLRAFQNIKHHHTRFTIRRLIELVAQNDALVEQTRAIAS